MKAKIIRKKGCWANPEYFAISLNLENPELAKRTSQVTLQFSVTNYNQMLDCNIDIEQLLNDLIHKAN